MNMTQTSENPTPAGGSQTNNQKKSLNFHKKSKKFMKPTSAKSLPRTIRRDIVFTYASTCCSVPAKKPACVKPERDSKELASLGKWRCGSCGKRCTVSRSKKGAECEANT